MERTRFPTTILTYDGIGGLDFMQPFDVLSICNQHAGNTPFPITLVAKHKKPVRVFGGLPLSPNDDFESAPAASLLIVPGGPGARHAFDDPQTIDYLRTTAPRTQLVASVCTGAFLLAKAGLLDGKAATTHWSQLHCLEQMFPEITVRSRVLWVNDQTTWTSAGVTEGTDMLLDLLDNLLGRQLALATANTLQHPYPESPSDPHLWPTPQKECNDWLNPPGDVRVADTVRPYSAHGRP